MVEFKVCNSAPATVFTSTTSLICPTSSVMSTVVAVPTNTTCSFTSDLLNPALDTVMLYFPATTLLKM